MSFDLYIENKGKVYLPCVQDGAEWETHRKDAPSRLSFTVIDDGNIQFEEGNNIKLVFNKADVFTGFIFDISWERDRKIKVVAFDQIRYLKYKGSYTFKNKTLTDIIKQIAEDNRLHTGPLAPTVFKHKSFLAHNMTFIDMIQEGIYRELMNTGILYILYDDFGKLTLRNIEELKSDFLIDEETAENYRYSSSINDRTFNKITVYRKGKDEGGRTIYTEQHGENINKWGMLQDEQSLTGKEDGKNRVSTMLKLFNTKTRRLEINKQLGDIKCRAGVSPMVVLDMGMQKVNHYMLIERARHVFRNGIHVMDLTMRGGDIV